MQKQRKLFVIKQIQQDWKIPQKGCDDLWLTQMKCSCSLRSIGLLSWPTNPPCTPHLSLFLKPTSSPNIPSLCFPIIALTLLTHLPFFFSFPSNAPYFCPPLPFNLPSVIFLTHLNISFSPIALVSHINPALCTLSLPSRDPPPLLLSLWSC